MRRGAKIIRRGPAPVLVSDIDSGEGSVRWPANWHTMSALMRADLLKDWLHELTGRYNDAVSHLGDRAQ